jgi:hypothetical protein
MIGRPHRIANLLAATMTFAFVAAPVSSETAPQQQIAVAFCGHAGTTTIPLRRDPTHRQDCPSGGCHSVCLRRLNWCPDQDDD